MMHFVAADDSRCFHAAKMTGGVCRAPSSIIHWRECVKFIISLSLWAHKLIMRRLPASRFAISVVAEALLRRHGDEPIEDIDELVASRTNERFR